MDELAWDASSHACKAATEPTTFYEASQSEDPMKLSAAETRSMLAIQHEADQDVEAYVEASRAKAR